MIKKLFKELTEARSLKNPVRSTLKWMILDLKMRKRIFVTLGVLVILQVMSFIPLPGINISVLQELLHRMTRAQAGSVINVTPLFSGGVPNQLQVFSLGLMPFFGACLLLQLATIFIPNLRKYSFGGEAGRDRVVKFTYILTLILSMIQAYLIALWLENPSRFQGMQIVANPGFGFRLVVTATMITSVFLLLFMAELINKYGVGNGFALIAVSPFILKLVPAVKSIIFLTQSGKVAAGFSLLLFAIFMGLAYAIFYVTTRAKLIELGDYKNKIVINFRSSIVGHEPIGWGTSLTILPVVIASFFSSTWVQNLAAWFIKGSIVYTIVSAVFIVVFTYLYTLIVFSPRHVSSLANKYGFPLLTVNNENPEDYLDDCMSRALMLTALVLVVVNLFPSSIMSYLRMPSWLSTLFGGTTLLMAVGIFSDILHQAEFFKSKADSGINNWAICYTAFDEFEAAIKAEFLKSRNIQALIEPLRFTWGIPVRTAVDQYRIYVPGEKKEEARGLLINQ